MKILFYDSSAELNEVPVVKGNITEDFSLGQDWIAAVGELRISHNGKEGFKVEVGQGGQVEWRRNSGSAQGDVSLGVRGT